jgi:hypothetical protein
MPPRTLTSIRMERRFNGPPDSANGGYAAGLVAGLVDAPVAAVRLHSPPPLDVDLSAEGAGDGTVTIRHGETLVATGRPAEPLEDVVPPVRPTVAEARAAMRSHFGFGRRHALSGCFVCGPDRPSDGLGVHFGPLPGHPDVNGAVVLTDATLPHRGSVAAPELVWAALDCPSYVPLLTRKETISLLGSLQAELLGTVGLGRPVVAVGWHESSEGRKHRTASALLDADGELIARARAVWIELPAPTPG